jgi:hypothetical protein
MLEFAAYLRDDRAHAPRSVYNKSENVMAFLKANGIRGIVGKNDWPRYTEEEPEIYEKAELARSPSPHLIPAYVGLWSPSVGRWNVDRYHAVGLPLLEILEWSSA